jgi:hypothetical protein
VEGERLADHRLAYLDYEGEVSDNRGTVTRVAAGEFELISETTDRLSVRLTKGALHGVLTIGPALSQPSRCRIGLESD